MKELVPFRVYFMGGPKWDQIPHDERQSMGETVQSQPLLGTEPHRFGFTKINQIGTDRVWGYFTQEYKAQLHKYDKAKKEHPYIDYPFEDALVALFFDMGVTLIQSRRFKDGTTSIGEVVENFTSAIRTVLTQHGLPFYGLEPYVVRYGRETFIDFFTRYPVLSLDVSRLLDSKVPPEFVFFNPEVERNRIVRDFLNKEFQSFDQVSIGSKGDESGLEKSKVAKVALEVGDPREMKYRQGANGPIRILRRKVGPTHTVEMDLDDVKGSALSESFDRVFSRDGGKVSRQQHLDHDSERDEDDDAPSTPG